MENDINSPQGTMAKLCGQLLIILSLVDKDLRMKCKEADPILIMFYFSFGDPKPIV